MKFSENWLRELVEVPADRAELTHRLTMCGLEVESTEALGEGLAGVLIGEILKAEQHPNADRLRVCEVSIGQQTLAIVCGAPNARSGLKAPLAVVGARLPGGLEIKAAKLRGVESFGMLCSARELGIDADASGLLELPADAPTGAALADWLGLPDAVIELGLTPNRSDCLGMRGLAMEVAAEFATEARLPAIEPVPATIERSLTIQLAAGAGCPRYCGRIIEGLDARASTPHWMAERLRRAGLRPISALVDVTNYVMLELGQPLHAFDADQVQGAVQVRRAHAGEPCKLLDGREVVLDPEFLVIADASGAIALAGVMGGHATRITDVTQRVFLESAHFAPGAISGRARKLGMHTDASHRFERGVDPELPRLALERATALLMAIAGGNAGPLVEATIAAELPQRQRVRLRSARLQRVLGIEIPAAEVERILRTLGMQVEADAGDWWVTPPSWRFDIEIEEDLIEEVARIHGYDQIPTVAPRGELVVATPIETRLPLVRLRERLLAADCYEAITYAFVSAQELERWGLAEGAVALANPLSADLAVMRTSLLPGLIAALRYNQNRQQTRVRLFELGRRYQQGGEGVPVEEAMLGIVLSGSASPEQWGASKRAVDFYDLKGIVDALTAGAQQAGRIRYAPGGPEQLHPGRSATVLLEGRAIGHFGALHPELAARLDLSGEVLVAELAVDGVLDRAMPKAQDLSRFPSVRRDLALVVREEIVYEQLEACARAAAGSLLRQSVLFDVYRGPGVESGCKSYAIGLIFQDDSRTLSDADVDQLVAAIAARASSDFGAQVRS
ncbi:MAG: phenylalanine--tRNA ligase subunit beta [Lysobacterales bacterium]